MAGRAQSRVVPSRIVSASPSITETLFALGLGDRVVGVSTYCRFPQAVLALPKVGTFLAPDAEVIARLRPDLVLLHKGPNAAASHLATLGLHTAVVESGTLPTVFTSIHAISRAAGVPERGDALERDIRAGLDAVRGAVAGKRRRRVLIIVGRSPGTLSDIIAVGPGSYLDDILSIAGGANVLASTAVQYPRISMETVISLAPDVLVDVGEMGESPADSARRQQVTERLWRQQRLVKAVREEAMHAINDEAFTVPGPRIVLVARTLAGWFHGVDLR
jgi:iron complex transport system substrate-binding protein